jgi:hypothetical protein
VSRARAELEPAFRATRYVVLLPDGELVLRVGAHDLDAERRLIAQLHLQRSWQLITPCNPGAELASPDTNRAVLQAFHRQLRDWAGTWQPTLTRSPESGWPEEPGALLVDADARWAHGLARELRQRAYLTATLGTAPTLVWLDD